jgi:hypothetical protein
VPNYAVMKNPEEMQSTLVIQRFEFEETVKSGMKATI